VFLYSTVLKSVFTEKLAATLPDGSKDTNGKNENKPKVKNEILFLLLGVDAEDVKESKGKRTDTMMLTKVNFDTGDVSILSIPRDTRVMIDGKPDKINHAHVYGGVESTMDTVRDFLGIDLDYYVKIDYNIVKEVVDAIGGVRVDVPFDMKYKEYDPSVPPLNIDIKKGEQQLLDGKNAHDFLRFRNNNAMTVGYKDGDIGRIKAQQYFMKELIKQTLKTKNLLKLPKLVETYFSNVETNISLGTALKAASSVKKINVDNIKTDTIPGDGEYIKNVSYWIYDREKMDLLVNEMFGDYID
jgi:LCP family protein required for cell wall assembly